MVIALKSKPVNSSTALRAAIPFALATALVGCGHTEPKMIPVTIVPRSSGPVAIDYDRNFKVGDREPVIMPRVPDGTSLRLAALLRINSIPPNKAAVVEILDFRGNRIRYAIIHTGTSYVFPNLNLLVKVESVDLANSSASIIVESFPE